MFEPVVKLCSNGPVDYTLHQEDEPSQGYQASADR